MVNDYVPPPFGQGGVPSQKRHIRSLSRSHDYGVRVDKELRPFYLCRVTEPVNVRPSQSHAAKLDAGHLAVLADNPERRHLVFKLNPFLLCFSHLFRIGLQVFLRISINNQHPLAVKADGGAC